MISSAVRWDDVAAVILDFDAGTVTPAQTVQRVGGRLVPLPRVARRVLVEHGERQAVERRTMAADGLWIEHGLVFPTSVGTPMEPRSLNRHFEDIRSRAGLPSVRLHDSGTPSSVCCWSRVRRRTWCNRSPGMPTWT